MSETPKAINTIEPTYEGDYVFAAKEPFRLAGGAELQNATLRYTLYGTLNAAKDNAILVCHALSGSSRVGDWWPELFGDGRAFNTERYCIIGVNILGSCYGSIGPTTIDAQTGKPYGIDFPLVTIGDIVRSQAQLIEHLGIARLHAVIGGSIGGMQALEWAIAFPRMVARCISIAATPLSAMGLALNHLQRQAITNDPAWRGGRYYIHSEQPVAGLALARALAMCSYKSAELFDERYHRRPNNRADEDPQRGLRERYDIAGYLDYQGRVFTRRFDANAYLIISKAMDTFELERNGAEEDATTKLSAQETKDADATTSALRRVAADVTLIGISSDWLFPAADVSALATQMRTTAGVNTTYHEFRSSHGHDAFLADAEKLAPLIAAALQHGRAAATSESAAKLIRVGAV